MNPRWSANLGALANRKDPGSRTLADQLNRVGPGPDLGLRSRTGERLPGIENGGKARSLVSTFDPAKEAARWTQGTNGGTVAVFGAGGAEAARALAAAEVRLFFWVEPRIEVWRSLFTWEDWADLVTDDRWVPCPGDADRWSSILLDRYHPVWDGGFRTLEWRTSVQGSEGLWDGYRRATARALETLASDQSTQARFGERWYRNTLINLRHLEPSSAPRCPGVRVVVAGAGPSLDDALDSPQETRWLQNRTVTGDRLFATDTALPALTARGVVPDLVFCLDGQLPSYHHFTAPRPSGVPLVADIAAIPLLGRVGMPVVRFMSGHPLGTVIRRFFPEIPWLDGSLGNVSGLAWSTAWALGARSVETWGVDFAYRNGQAYAHGTYVYPQAGRRATRIQPLETLLGTSAYGALDRERTWDSQGRALDTTPLLREYRNRWTRSAPPSRQVTLENGATGDRWKAFIAHWKAGLETLPVPGPREPMTLFVQNLPEGRRQEWLALWPLSLALHRQGTPTEELARLTVQRALEVLQES